MRELWKKQASAPHTGSGPDTSNSICLDIFELTIKNSIMSNRLYPYVDYFAAVINMYCHMCLSRNQLGIKKVKELGLSFDHILASISPNSSNKKKKNVESIDPIDKKLISAYVFSSRVMFIDNDLFPKLSTYNNRCYL